MGGGPLPSPARSQSDATPLARTPSPAGRLPPAAVPPGRRPAVHRRPHRGGPRARPSGEIKATWLDRIFSPLVTLWVFLGQVLSADHSCRAAVARLIAHRVAQGQRAVQLRDGGVLPGAEAPARAVLLRRGPPRGAEPGRAGRPAVAVEGPPRLPVRRLDGLHARHAGEPARVPPGLQPDARDRASPSPGSGPSSRCRAGRSSTWASAATPARGRARSACCARLWDVLRPGDVLLGDRLMSGWVGMVPAQAARGRHRQPPLGAPPGRLPQGDAPGQGRPPRRVEEADVDPLGGPARRTTRCPTRSRSARCRFRVEQPGFRTRSVVVVTTLLDPEQASQGGPGLALPGPVEQRARPAVDQGHAADGRAAVQDAGAGPQGDLDPRPGLQPDPHGHGPGGRPRGDRRRGRSASRRRSRCWRRSGR